MKIINIIFPIALLAPVSMQASDQIKNDTLPFTYQRFISQAGISHTKLAQKSQAPTLSLYRINDNFYLEIPKKALDRDVLVSMREVGGYSGFVSPKSGIVRFVKGKDKHSLFLRSNRSVDVQADSTDTNMMEAIRRSGMLPIDMAFTVVSEGDKGESLIIDISNDVNSPQGLFDVSSNSSLNRPDASRSEVLYSKAIDGGVVIGLSRSQTDMINNTMTTQIEVAETRRLEFLLQLLPEHKTGLKLNNPFYGFETFSRQEYDTKTYVSRRREYISRWNLNTAQPIVVYLSPSIPQPFRESVIAAFNQWGEAFAATGYKKVFRFSTDEHDATLSYGHILVNWGSVEPSSDKIVDELSGEIVAGCLNISDRFFDDWSRRYYILCRHIDKRVVGDKDALGARQDILEAYAAREIGQLLGLKPNNAGLAAFSPSQLRSSQWLSQNGISASVTDELAFNYVAQDGDGVTAKGLLPRVSVYDREAIAYAYGKSQKAPSMPSTYYASYDPLKDIYLPKRALSNDWIEAARLGINNMKKSYALLHSDMGRMSADVGTPEEERQMYLIALGEYQQLLENVAALVGRTVQLPIQRGLNEEKYHFTPREVQQQALNFLKSEILLGAPTWSDTPEVRHVLSGNISGMMRAIAVSIYKRWLTKEVAGRLVNAENTLGDKTFTTRDLYRFIDRELFCDFDAARPLPEYQRLLIMNVIPDLADKVFAADLSLGLGDDGAVALHHYFMHIAEKINLLASEHTDDATRQAYQMVKMRLDRQYFNRQHQ